MEQKAERMCKAAKEGYTRHLMTEPIGEMEGDTRHANPLGRFRRSSTREPKFVE